MGCAHRGVDRGLDQVDEIDGVDLLTAEMAPVEEPPGQLAAEHARAAGDEDAHRRQPRPTRGMSLAMTVIVSRGPPEACRWP